MKHRKLNIALTIIDIALLIVILCIPGWHWAKITCIILTVVSLVLQFVKVRIVDDSESRFE